MPVYLFVFGMLALIAIGGLMAATGNLGLAPSAEFTIVPEEQFVQRPASALSGRC